MFGKTFIISCALSSICVQALSAAPLEGGISAPGFAQPSDSFNLAMGAPGIYEIPVGSKLTAIMATPVDTHTASIGDPVEAVLGQPLYAGGRLVADKGASIHGTVAAVDRARNELRSKLSTYHWLDADGGVAIRFDTITLHDKSPLFITAEPAPDTEVVPAMEHEAPMVIDKNGEVVPKPESKKVKTLGLAIDAAGLFAPFGAGVAAGALAGAVAPTYSLGTAGAAKTDHQRIKGAFIGAVDGLPGVGIAHSIIKRGTHACLETGDSITIIFEQPAVWRVKPASVAQDSKPVY